MDESSHFHICSRHPSDISLIHRDKKEIIGVCKALLDITALFLYAFICAVQGVVLFATRLQPHIRDGNCAVYSELAIKNK